MKGRRSLLRPYPCHTLPAKQCHAITRRVEPLYGHYAAAYSVPAQPRHAGSYRAGPCLGMPRPATIGAPRTAMEAANRPHAAANSAPAAPRHAAPHQATPDPSSTRLARPDPNWCSSHRTAASVEAADRCEQRPRHAAPNRTMPCHTGTCCALADLALPWRA
jgi:hypothetical protein